MKVSSCNNILFAIQILIAICSNRIAAVEQLVEAGENAEIAKILHSMSPTEIESLLEELYTSRDKKSDASFVKNNEPSCYEKMTVSDNKILHSKDSIKNGATFLDVQFIEADSGAEMVLHEKCMDYCCGTKTCDTTLLSLTKGEKGYRCYVFNCSNKCLFVEHKDYSVMSMKHTPGEPLPVTTKAPTKPVAETPSPTTRTTTTTTTTTTTRRVILTEPPILVNPIENTIANVIQGLEDKSSFMTGPIIAIVLLTVGLLLTGILLAYYMVRFNKLNSRFRWQRANAKMAATGDAEADYLIDGMNI